MEKTEHCNEITVDGESLTIEDVVAVARDTAKVAISRAAEEKVNRCRRILEELVDKKTIYGVNTGFGSQSKIHLPRSLGRELQLNLIRSHSAGIGKPLSKEIVRALMVLRANALAKGYSGVKLGTLHTLVEMLNKRVHPMIPEKGSVGASGDLYPLAHLTLAMIGEGDAEYQGHVMTKGTALQEAGISKIELDSKEGLALINGTQLMTAVAALTLHDAEQLVKVAEIVSVMTLEALKGRSGAFDNRLQLVRSHEGQVTCANNIRMLISGSELIERNDEKVTDKIVEVDRAPQDPYCLRCIPQVFGAVRDSISYVRRVIQKEINSATDNPLIFPDDEAILFGGNFHGQPIALAMDLLGIALTTIGNMSERRTAKLFAENQNIGLPSNLIPSGVNAGLNVGIGTALLTASALASENKVLAHPASTDSIPDASNFEDFVSMGPFAARKGMEILENVQYIFAIEALCAAQALDFRESQKLGGGTRVAYQLIREKVATLKEDRPIYEDIEKTVKLVQSGQLVRRVEKEIGNLA